MSNKYLKFYVLLFITGIFCPVSYAQLVYANGQLELADGVIKTGDLAYQTTKGGNQLIFRAAPNRAPVTYEANDIRSFQIGNERYISWQLNDDPTTPAVFLRNLVVGPVGLYLYERKDGVNVFLLEQSGKFTPISAIRPSVTLATLPDCGQLRPTNFNSPLSLTSRQLVRYVLAYNRCKQPGVASQAYETSPRSLKISIGPRVFLPVSSCRLKFNDGGISPQSTVSAKPGIGVSINLTWRGRLGAGLDLALMSRNGKWNTDTTVKKIWAVDELTSQSLYVSPYLRYEFRRHNDQRLTPYVIVGIVFNKLLNGKVVVNRYFTPGYNPYFPYHPWKLPINQEAGIDEFGGSLGGGLVYQLTNRLQAVADIRLLYAAAITSVFEIPYASSRAVQFSTHTYVINSSFGINFTL